MAVYAMLARHCHMPKRACKVSLVRLSEKLGWKRDTINKALDNLIKCKLIERGERDNGGAYTYTLTHRHRSKKKEKKAA
jgi:predicted transcriptional regulator